MTWKNKLWERVRLGFTITEPLSKRGREIPQNDSEAGYKVIDAVLNAQKEGGNKGRVIAKHIKLANEEYDLIQA